MGVPPASSCDAVLFMPGLGPGTPFRFDAFDGGANMPFVAAGVDAAFESASLGVAAAGAGVSLAASFFLSSAVGALFAGVDDDDEVAEASDFTAGAS